MKKPFNIQHIVLLIALSTVLWACPYESQQPLLGKSIATDTLWLGKWKCDSVQLTIAAADSGKLSISYTDYEKNEADTIRGIAVAIRKGKSKYLVMETSQHTYFAAQIVKSKADELTINLMDDMLLKKQPDFTSAEAFSEFVYSHHQDCFLPYNKGVFRRMK